MLIFEPFSLATLQRVLPYLRDPGVACSDLSAGALYMWQEGTDLRFCEWNDTLVVRQDKGEQPAFSLPIGKDPDGMIDELLQYAKENHLPLRFFAVDEESLEKIKNDSRLKDPAWTFDPRWSDYVYSFADAKTFPGRKFSGQRNHINQFKKLYGEPDVRRLTPEDLPAVRDMLSAYEAEHTPASRLERLELERTKSLLSAYGSLGLCAAGLFVNGSVAAFTIGEVSGDTLFIHVEKALKRYRGAYPAIYSGFVRMMDETPGCSLQTVNREDDSGDPGLRTSKMQYHPIKKIDKYLVHVDSPAKRIPSIPEIASGGIVLTPLRETDKPAYRALNTDVQNNLYWGYDYREDANLTEPIDENTFYDATDFDTRVGDSVNFAVRLSPGGDLIGEAILWNFTSDGYAELGCRLFPEYQGRGYGKAAFRAAADFAESALRVKVYARCFPENLPSYRMIAASGFEPCCADGNYQYFTHKSAPRPSCAVL